jgi:hypothetical protein
MEERLKRKEKIQLVAIFNLLKQDKHMFDF